MATIAIDSKKSSWLQIIPVMFCFFAMGFVDLVGTACNSVKGDLNLTNTEASFIPSLVFFWFLIFSVPTGMLMNKIGRKNTVMVSLIVTLVSLILPLFGNSYSLILVAFSLLGIGNAIMQTSLNPLVSNLISPDKLASTLTFGQFVKAIASLGATIIIPWGAVAVGSTFGLGWRVIFAIYGIVGLLSVSILAATPIKEEKPDKASGFFECIKLLGIPFILLCFIGIICHVGIDVGTNATAQRIIGERVGVDPQSAVATMGVTVYFICRMVGCFLGGFLLRVMSPKVFFGISVLIIVAGTVILFFAHSLILLYVAFGLLGFGNSNVFSVIFAQAINHSPNEQNEVSGLMIMGLIGGFIFPLCMGWASDIFNHQNAAVAVMAIAVVYLLLYTLRIKKA